MLSCSLNIILKSFVSEQAYLPLSLPDNGCVCKRGSCTSSASLSRVISYSGSNCGSFCKSFPAFLRKEGAKSNSRFIPDCFHGFFDSFKAYRRLCLCFKHPFNKSFAAALPVGKIINKSSCFTQSIPGKRWKNFLDVFHFINRRFHGFSIS